MRETPIYFAELEMMSICQTVLTVLGANLQPSDVRIAAFLHIIRYRICLRRCRRRPRLVVRRPIAATRSDKSGPPSIARSPRTSRWSHPTSGRSGTFPVAQAAADL